MNYVRWNFGDWAVACGGLTPAEEGIYFRLLRWYYANESPLPNDLKALCRLTNVHGHSLNVVKAILELFFHLQGDTWHHHRADKEIARYHEGAPAREQRKLEAKLRGARYFIGHKAARDFLKSKGVEGLHRGITMDHLKNIANKLGAAEAMLRAVQDAQDAYKNAALAGRANAAFPQPANARLHPPISPPATTGNTPQTLSARNASKPQTINHIKGNAFTPPKNDSNSDGAPADGAATPAARVCLNTDEQAIQTSETATAIAQHARAAGIAYANPRDDLLRALLVNGATLDDFAIAVAQAKATDKGWAYMLGIVRERQADATRMRQQATQSGLERANGNADRVQAVPTPATPLTPFVTAEVAADPERVRAILAPLRASLTKR
jgi:uncharacterized protein YdaU (DUF1376 family)